MAYIPKEILEAIKYENSIQDRGFMSASALGGLCRWWPCNEESYRVKFQIHSKTGKHVDSLAFLTENEVLFRPFTKFKILHHTGDEISGFKIELEEIKPPT